MGLVRLILILTKESKIIVTAIYEQGLFTHPLHSGSTYRSAFFVKVILIMIHRYLTSSCLIYFCFIGAQSCHVFCLATIPDKKLGQQASYALPPLTILIIR